MRLLVILPFLWATVTAMPLPEGHPEITSVVSRAAQMLDLPACGTACSGPNRPDWPLEAESDIDGKSFASNSVMNTPFKVKRDNWLLDACSPGDDGDDDSSTSPCRACSDDRSGPARRGNWLLDVPPSNKDGSSSSLHCDSRNDGFVSARRDNWLLINKDQAATEKELEDGNETSDGIAGHGAPTAKRDNWLLTDKFHNAEEEDGPAHDDGGDEASRSTALPSFSTAKRENWLLFEEHPADGAAPANAEEEEQRAEHAKRDGRHPLVHADAAEHAGPIIGPTLGSTRGNDRILQRDNWLLFKEPHQGEPGAEASEVPTASSSQVTATGSVGAGMTPLKGVRAL